MDDFSLTELKCYSHCSYSNVGFYFKFGSNIDRYSFEIDSPPTSKKFRSKLLSLIQSEIEKCKNDDKHEQRALYLYLQHLENAKDFPPIFSKSPKKHRDLIKYIEKLESKNCKAIPELRLLFRIQNGLI